jgi:hypothetical protein
MIDYAVHSLTPVAPHVQQNAGLLYTPGDALLGMAYFAIMALAGYLMLSYAGSIAPLWGPIGRFFGRLRFRLPVEWVFAFTCDMGVLTSKLSFPWPPQDEIEGKEQLQRLAYEGFPEQIIT